MNTEETYQHILSELKLGHRGLVRLGQDDLDELNDKLISSLGNNQELEKNLCILEHSAALYQKCEENLLKVLNGDVSSKNIIFALNCSRKHIIEARFQKGHRLDYEFLETLKRLLHHRDPEIVEWSLRLIEGTGNQGIYFLREFDKIKPPPWKWFNSHQRAIREIITLLERRWGHIEKSKP